MSQPHHSGSEMPQSPEDQIQKLTAELQQVRAQLESANGKLVKTNRRLRRWTLTAEVGFLLLVVLVCAAASWYQMYRSAEHQRQKLIEREIRAAIDNARAVRQKLHEQLKDAGGVFKLLDKPGEWRSCLSQAQAALETAKALHATSGQEDSKLLKQINELDSLLSKDDDDFKLAKRLSEIRARKEYEDWKNQLKKAIQTADELVQLRQELNDALNQLQSTKPAAPKENKRPLLYDKNNDIPLDKFLDPIVANPRNLLIAARDDSQLHNFRLPSQSTDVQAKDTKIEKAIRNALQSAAAHRNDLRLQLQKSGGVFRLLNDPAKWRASIQAAQSAIEHAKILESLSEKKIKPKPYAAVNLPFQNKNSFHEILPIECRMCHRMSLNVTAFAHQSAHPVRNSTKRVVSAPVK